MRVEARKARCLLLALSLLLSGAVSRAEAAPSHPNVVVILADDMGWKDVGYHGSEIETPNLDRLAASGAELDRFYAMPSCSPTRAALLTGQLPLRLGLLRPLSKLTPTGLPLDRKLLPQFLAEAGYETALSGKWHLGYLDPAYHPNQRGFQSFYGHVTGGVGYWDHVHGGGYDWQRDGTTVRSDRYTTHLVTEEAERVIRERDPAKPFFLYVAFNAPHLPNEAPEAALARYAHIADPRRRAHAAMVSELDSGVGQIVRVLEEEGIAEETILWFSSDNGGLNEAVAPAAYKEILATADRFFDRPFPLRILRFLQTNVEDGGADNGELRRGKQSVFEGGVRVPAFVSWPGTIAPQRVEQRMSVADVLPTLLEAAGLPPVDGEIQDGASRWGALNGKPGSPLPDLATAGADGLAYYSGDLKMIRTTDGERLLFDLANDPTEANDLASARPDVVEALDAKLDAFPRGEDVGLPLWRIALDPDEFGGEERGTPMADRTLAHAGTGVPAVLLIVPAVFLGLAVFAYRRWQR